MSPNEAQLRAALRDGEGDGVDVGQVIAEAVSTRAHRRQRINAAIAGAGVVAVIGLGIGALVVSGVGGQSEGGGGSAGGNGAANAYRAGGESTSAAAGGAAPSTGSSATSVLPGGIPASRCPSQPAATALPDAQGSTTPEAKLFARPVTSLRLCIFGPSYRAAFSVTDRSDVRDVVDSLESAPSRRSSAKRCTPNSALVGETVQITARTSGGDALRPVVVQIRCGLSIVSNGIAVRYVRNLPAQLVSAASGSVGGPAVGGPGPPGQGRQSGSPIHT